MGQLERLEFQDLLGMDHGRIRMAIDSHLASVLQECRLRPCNAQNKSLKRKVLIEVEVEPLSRLDEFGQTVWDRVSAEVKIQSKTPAMVSSPISLKVGRDAFYYNPDSPEDLSANNLPFGDDDE